MGKLITQFVETPNGGDVFLQAVPTTQQTADALAIATAITGRTLVQSDDPRLSGLRAAALLATRLALKTGSVTIGAASDSSGNDQNDWLGTWTRLVAATDPALRVEWQPWNDTTLTYAAATVIQAGTVIPATGGTVQRDTFTRTVAELVGSTPDTGTPWTGAAGIWSANGSTAKGSGGGMLSKDTGARDCTITAKLKVTTTGTGAAQNFRAYVSNVTATGSGAGVFVAFSLPANGTGLSLTLFKSILGVSTQLAQSTMLGLVTNSAVVQDVTLTLQVNIQNITVTWTSAAGTVTLTGALTEADYLRLGTYSGPFTSIASPGVLLDEVTLDTPYTAAATRVLKVISASKAGGTLQYQQDNLAAMFPASPQLDLLIVAHGHNYSTFDGTYLTDRILTFVAAVRAAHPKVLPVLSSQNPEKAPSTLVEVHRSRQSAVRLLAAAQGWTYIAAMEAFLAQADGGASLITADGIHPTTPPAGTTTAGYGATLWAQTWQNLIIA